MSTYIKINGEDILYPAVITGRMADKEWDNRETKAITLEMDYTTANELFVNGVIWSIVMEHTVEVEKIDDEGNTTIETVIETEEFDNSEYSLAGNIIDHRDGSLTIHMAKKTEAEIQMEQFQENNEVLAILLGEVTE